MLNLLQFSEINKEKMSNKITISICCFVLYGGIISAQSSLPGSLSFNQAISMAIKNNPDLKIKDFDQLIATEQYNEAKLRMLPQIYGRYDIQRNLIIPSTLVPLGQFNPDLPPDELTPIKFGTNWTSIAGIFASVKLFDPQTIGDIKEKKSITGSF